MYGRRRFWGAQDEDSLLASLHRDRCIDCRPRYRLDHKIRLSLTMLETRSEWESLNHHFMTSSPTNYANQIKPRAFESLRRQNATVHAKKAKMQVETPDADKYHGGTGNLRCDQFCISSAEGSTPFMASSSCRTSWATITASSRSFRPFFSAPDKLQRAASSDERSRSAQNAKYRSRARLEAGRPETGDQPGGSTGCRSWGYDLGAK